MNTKVKGYVLGAVAAASYGMNPLFAIPLYRAGMTPDSVLFFRYLLAIPLLAIMLKARGRGLALSRGTVLPMIVMGLLMAVSSLTLFESYNYMDVGIASTLLFIYPILVTLIMRFFFKERISLQMAVCILFALLGVGLLYNVGDSGSLSVAGTILVLASALSYAIYIVAVNQSDLKNVPTLQVTFFVLVFGLSLFIIRLLSVGDVRVPDASQWYLWGNVLGLAVFPTAVSFLCTTSAIHCIGSTPTAILGALEPVTAVIIGVAILGEKMTPGIATGLILIIVSVTLVIAGGNITSHLVHFRKLFPRLK